MRNTIYINDKFETAIRKLNILKNKILIVLNKKQVICGSITDGDIRRSFLNSRKKTIKNVMNSNPLSITKNFLNKLSMKEKNKYRFAPLIDKEKKFVRLINLRDYFNPKSITVFIFAGGKGLRLRPLTKNLPKPLIKIKNKTIIEKLINSLHKSGFNNFFVSVNYKKKIIISHLNNNIKKDIKLSFVKEKRYLGTAGSLGLLKNKKKNILVVNADILTNLNFKNLVFHHITNNYDLTICIKDEDNRIPYGVVNINDNRIVSLKEKPVEKYYFSAGIYVLNSKIIKIIPKNKKIDMPELISLAIKKKYKIFPFYIHENWVDIGSRETLIKLDRAYKKYFEKLK